ncbi:MAG: murein biosynthesis integral membrane protein MurJ [Phycisphaerales bacterium]|nr:MAG: murein biosynthesis integral membrane protein MurJ [Phycisphaerales bacterium]
MPDSGRVVASARLIAGLTLCSRVLGLLRECVFSHFFSISELLSAFRIAFMAPNLARRLFGEGALSSAMIPTLTESIENRGEQQSRRFVGSLLTVLVVVLIVIVVVAETVIVAWRAVQDDTALHLAGILLPYMIFICTVAVASGVLNVRGHFAAPAAMPIVLNLSIIGGTLGGAFLADLRELELIVVLCISVLVAGVVQLIVTGVALKAVSFYPLFGRGWRDPQIRTVLKLMAPMMIGLSAVQINSLADYLIAYIFVVEEGKRVGPAVLGYAHYLYQLPLGVFGIALATAVFPVLSQRAAQGDHPGLAELTGRGVRLGSFIALPAAVGLIFVAQPLVATLYQHGEFDAASTKRVAGVLVFYSLGMPAYFAQHIIVRAFYAMKDSRTPARIATRMVGINFVMNLVLVFPLQERGLALATAVCAMIQVVWLARKLRRTLPQLVWGDVATQLIKPIIATVIMAAVLVALVFGVLTTASIEVGSTIQLIVLVVIGVAVYALTARLLRVQELQMILHRDRAFEVKSDTPDTIR